MSTWTELRVWFVMLHGCAGLLRERAGEVRHTIYCREEEDIGRQARVLMSPTIQET